MEIVNTPDAANFDCNYSTLILFVMVSLAGDIFRIKKPRIQRESLPLANRIFLASGLKFANRKFFHALTGKMLASGFVSQRRRNFGE